MKEFGLCPKCGQDVFGCRCYDVPKPQPPPPPMTPMRKYLEAKRARMIAEADVSTDEGWEAYQEGFRQLHYRSKQKEAIEGLLENKGWTVEMCKTSFPSWTTKEIKDLAELIKIRKELYIPPLPEPNRIVTPEELFS